MSSICSIPRMYLHCYLCEDYVRLSEYSIRSCYCESSKGIYLSHTHMALITGHHAYIDKEETPPRPFYCTEIEYANCPEEKIVKVAEQDFEKRISEEQQHSLSSISHNTE